MSPTSRRRPRYAVGCALAAIAATLASPVWADPAPTYAQLLAQLGNAPATLEAGANYDAAEARVRQARVRPNPVLGFDVENAYGSGPYSGLNNADMTLAISQDLELWGRRSTRIAAARAEAGAVGLQRDLAVIDAAGRLALIYAEAEAAQRRATLAEETLTLTVADARAALTLVEEGREPLLRGIQGEAEAASARATRDEAVAERDAAYARLTAVAMIPVPVTQIEDSLLDEAPTTIGSVIEDAPTVRVAEAQRSAAERRIDVQRVQARPAINASIGIAADGGVTAAEEAYRLSRIGFESGRISQVELRVTRTALVNARSAAVDARLARVRAEIDLARLDGRAPFEGAQ